MKSDNIIWIILLIVFLLLGGTEVFLYKQYQSNMDKLNEQSVVNTASYKETVVSSDLDYEALSDKISGEDISMPDNHTYIFVGDSRYVAMSECAEPTDTFFCENGVGLYFLKSNMSDILAKADSNTRIIIGLGVNDVAAGNDGYIQTLQQLYTQTEAEVYYMLVNPVNEDACRRAGYTITNAGIESFNTKMLEGLNGSGIKIIDTYTFLCSNGYKTGDGLHYDEETTQTIYNFIKLCLRNQ